MKTLFLVIWGVIIALKIAGVTTLSWGWVLSPLIVIGVLILFGILKGIKKAFEDWMDRHTYL